MGASERESVRAWSVRAVEPASAIALIVALNVSKSGLTLLRPSHY
jgi:hypothetical protein